MLEKIHSWAIRLLWVRPLAVCLGTAALLSALYLILIPSDAGNNTLLIAALLIFCWSLLIYSLVTIFQEAPPQIEPKLGFIKRQLTRLRRTLYILLALGFLLLTLSLLVVSYQLMITELG